MTVATVTASRAHPVEVAGAPRWLYTASLVLRVIATMVAIGSFPLVMVNIWRPQVGVAVCFALLFLQRRLAVHAWWHIPGGQYAGEPTWATLAYNVAANICFLTMAWALTRFSGMYGAGWALALSILWLCDRLFNATSITLDRQPHWPSRALVCAAPVLLTAPIAIWLGDRTHALTHTEETGVLGTAALFMLATAVFLVLGRALRWANARDAWVR